MQHDQLVSLLFLFRKLKWIFPLIFFYYVVNSYVLTYSPNHSPHPCLSSQFKIIFPYSKQLTVVCFLGNISSIYILFKLYLIGVVLWLVLLRTMLILLTKIRFVTFNTNLCQLHTTIHLQLSQMISRLYHYR